MTQNMILRPAVLALALSSVFLSGAQAADVTIYGIIDTGLNYQHVDQDESDAEAKDQFQMKGSQTIPNRWGLKGTEDLGNGYKVGFMLEGQFGSDDGTMTGGRLFQRAAQVQISNDSFGTLVMGRSGALRSGFGTTGIWAIRVNPFSNSWGDYLGGSKYTMPGGFKAIDNAVTYQSPVFGGVQLHAQYSFKINSTAADQGPEGKASADRQWGVGATYNAGNLHVAAVLDSVLYANDDKDYDDSLAFSLGGHYNFEFMKLYASGMYFADMKGNEFQGDHQKFDVLADQATYKGYSLMLAADVPMGAGVLKANLGYMNAEVDQLKDQTVVGDGELDRFNIGVGYEYPLSKRTKLYAGAGWVQEKSDERDPNAYEVLAGLMTRF